MLPGGFGPVSNWGPEIFTEIGTIAGRKAGPLLVLVVRCWFPYHGWTEWRTALDFSMWESGRAFRLKVGDVLRKICGKILWK